MKNFRFCKSYGIVCLLLFILEIFIALYITQPLIRGTVGDILVVMLIYTFILTFFNWRWDLVLTGTLVFAFLVEILQYFRLIHVLNLQNNTFFRTVLGSTFDWMDITAYLSGGLIIAIVEILRRRRNSVFING